MVECKRGMKPNEQIVEIQKDEHLLTQDQKDLCMYFVTRGSVKFLSGQAAGSLFGVNEAFGEKAFATGRDAVR